MLMNCVTFQHNLKLNIVQEFPGNKVYIVIQLAQKGLDTNINIGKATLVFVIMLESLLFNVEE